MRRLVLLLGSLIGSLVIGAVMGLILYFVADVFGLLRPVLREFPFPDLGHRLPFGGFVVVGALLGLLLNVLGRIQG